MIMLNYAKYKFNSTTVISEPDNVTICEGEGTVFTCVLNSNIRSDDVQWYRFIKDTNTTVMVDPNGGNINFLTHTNESTTNSLLTITNAIRSYTGYFWVGTPSLNICNATLTVLASKYVCSYMYVGFCYTYVHTYTLITCILSWRYETCKCPYCQPAKISLGSYRVPSFDL